MKKIIIIMLIAFVYQIKVYSQFQLIADLQTNNELVELNNGDLKLMSLDKKQKSIDFKNLDNSLWMSFKLNTNKFQNINDIHLLDLRQDEHDSTHVFLLYSTYFDELMPIEDFSEKFHSSLTYNITNTRGDILLQVNQATDYKILGSYPESKLVIFKLNKKGFRSKKSIEIFSLNNYSLSL